MAEKRGRFWRWLLPRLLIFAVGIGVGYYARDRQAVELREAYEQAIDEMEQLKRAGQEAMDRGRRAGEGLKAGAKAAADSTRAAVQEIAGQKKN